MTILLIDGDILLHRAASAAQKRNRPDAALSIFHAIILSIKRKYRSNSEIIALSSARNWRRRLYPAYKRHRPPRPHQSALQALRPLVQECYETRETPGLEADDVLGILLTNSKSYGQIQICVSGDKDLLSVPGLHARRDGGVIEVTPAAADRAHLTQTLTGDRADGYPGCPGVGAKTAAAFLQRPYRLDPAPCAGRSRQRWRRAPTDQLWAGIVSLYRRRGLDEADALLQARIARILRADEYDPIRNQPILWTPDRLRGRR